MTDHKHTNLRAVALKTFAGFGTIALLWLIALAQAYANLVDSNSPWHWQLARSIPGIVVAIYVTGILMPWLRYIRHTSNA